MREETIQIFKFEELPEESQVLAIERYRQDNRDMGGDYFWSDEWVGSLKEFCDTLGLSDPEYSVAPYCPSFALAGWDDEDINELTGERLRTWVINNWVSVLEKGRYYIKSCSELGANKEIQFKYKSRHSAIQKDIMGCVLTGFCGDDSLVYYIDKFIRGQAHYDCLQDLIDDCLEKWVRDFQGDLEYQESDEYIREHMIANDYEFLSDGAMH